MMRVASFGSWWVVPWLAAPVLVVLTPATSLAGTECGTVDEFNASMAANGTTASEVTLTFDVTGIHPGDYFNGKGSIAQMRNTTCAGGQDATIKLYGDSEPLNEAHPPGTLKLEYGNACCGGACGEQWADPNPSAVIFVDGTEQCSVTMQVTPTEVGYAFACNGGSFDALGQNPEGNMVDRIALLEYVLPDGGTTWEMPNATASNDQVCWVAATPPPPDPGADQTLVVPVLEDVATGPAWPDMVFPDVFDLAVENDGTQAYLKFVVPPIDGKVTSVELIMRTGIDPSSEGDGGEVHAVTDNGWSEATMTWTTRPPFEAASFGRIGPAGADQEVSLDLGATAVSWAGGTYGFAVFSPPTDGNGTHFVSKESSPADAAHLTIHYVVVDADADGTPDGPDCDDADASVGPDATESCNGLDDDCDGTIDEDCQGGVDDSGGGTADDGGSGEPTSGEDGFVSGPGLGGDSGGTGCACTTAPSGPAEGGRAMWLGVLALWLRRRSRSRRREACSQRAATSSPP